MKLDQKIYIAKIIYFLENLIIKLDRTPAFKQSIAEILKDDELLNKYRYIKDIHVYIYNVPEMKMMKKNRFITDLYCVLRRNSDKLTEEEIKDIYLKLKLVYEITIN